MLKKIARFFFSIILAFVIVFGGFWVFFGDTVKEEYAAYKKSSAPILLYHAVGEPVEIEWPPGMILSWSARSRSTPARRVSPCPRPWVRLPVPSMSPWR